MLYSSPMQTTIDLKQMSLPDKLSLMEALWDELCRREEEVPVAEWHKQVLNEREQQIKEGKATFGEWEGAKERIRKRVS